MNYMSTTAIVSKSSRRPDTVLAWPFLLFMIVGLIFPSTGGHSLFNPKNLTAILAMGCTCLHAMTQLHMHKSQILLVLISLCLMLLLSWSLFIFLTEHPSESLASPLDQLKIYVVTIAAAAMLIYWYLVNRAFYPVLIRVMLYSNFAFCLAKSIFVMLVILGYVKITIITDLGFSLMSTGIAKGIGRLQLSTDIPTPFLLFFALMSSSLGVKLPKFFLPIYVILSLVSIFFSYSRFLWVATVIGYVCFVWATASLLGLMRQFMLVILLAAATMGILGTDRIEFLVNKRFFSKESRHSDSFRHAQANALMHTFHKTPICGSGVGSWAEGCIRDKGSPHNYEVQWLAVLMQLGIIGIIPITCILGEIGISFLKYSISRVKLAFFLVYCLWIVAGFTNPFVLSLNSGLLYGLFLVSSWWISKDEPFNQYYLVYS